MLQLHNDYGDVTVLCHRLKTNAQDGCVGDDVDLTERRRVFGRNVIPAPASKSFFQLVFEAVQDTTLLILLGCAVVSLGLSFYHPDNGEWSFRTG
jgi:Ca2+ transporting ATPase